MSGKREIKIRSCKRDTEAEKKWSASAKADYMMRSGTAYDLQKILTGRIEGEYTFIIKERIKVTMDVPRWPECPSHEEWNGVVVEPGTEPSVGILNSVNFGRPEEQIARPGNVAFPMLRLDRMELGLPPGCIPEDLHQGENYAPLLGITNSWNEPVIQSGQHTWKHAAIEDVRFYDELAMNHRLVIPIRDTVGIIRHLITILPWGESSYLILPLSYAQHPNYSLPLSCYFPFELSWWLLNSEYLDKFSQAEVVITNEIGVALGNRPDKRQIILGYFFGIEMIQHLHFECLRGRSVYILIVRSPVPSLDIARSFRFFEKITQENRMFFFSVLLW